MTTVGEIFSKARVEKGLTLEQVEKATHIRLKFLVAIEKNEFDKVPPGTFAKGFIKNYAAFLGLSISDMLAFYRRQVSEGKSHLIPVHSPETIIKRFAFTPQFFTAVSVVLLLVAFFGYLVYSYFSFAGNPVLIVVKPSNNSVVREQLVEVSGKTDSDATLMINDQQVAIKDDGQFEVKIPLQPGLNSLTITSTNKFKRQSSVSRNVRLEM